MGRRLLRAAASRGVSDLSLLKTAFERAMGPRLTRLSDDHDPRFLHPARTALILLDDLGETDPRALATAILAETEDRSLRCAEEPSEDDPPNLRAALVTAHGLPGMEKGEELTEILVTAPDPIPAIALAEYLDQLRHLRLWADAERVRARGRIAAELLVPLAERVHPVLARRFRWWVRRVVGGSPTADEPSTPD